MTVPTKHYAINGVDSTNKSIHSLLLGSWYLYCDDTDTGRSLNSSGGLAVTNPSSSRSWDLFLRGKGEKVFLWGVEVATGPAPCPTSPSPPATVLLRTRDPLSKLTCFWRRSSRERSGVLADRLLSGAADRRWVVLASLSSSTLRLGWNRWGETLF